MPKRRDKNSAKQDFLKRRSFEQGRALVDAAHAATYRLYNDALRYWRRCDLRSCKRHRRCCGEAWACFNRNYIHVPQWRRLRARVEVIAGGRRRRVPASHIEWTVRRLDFQTLIKWMI